VGVALSLMTNYNCSNQRRLLVGWHNGYLSRAC